MAPKHERSDAGNLDMSKWSCKGFLLSEKICMNKKRTAYLGLGSICSFRNLQRILECIPLRIGRLLYYRWLSSLGPFKQAQPSWAHKNPSLYICFPSQEPLCTISFLFSPTFPLASGSPFDFTLQFLILTSTIHLKHAFALSSSTM